MRNSGKRFLYVGGFRLPDKNAAAHRVLSVANILKILGYDVVFLDVSDEKQEYDLSSMHRETGYDTYSQKRPGGTKHWASYVLNPLYVEEVLDKYTDWAGVIAYNYPALALHKLKKICHKRNIKIFADCTEWYQYGFSLSVRNIALMIDTFFRMRLVQKKLDGLIVISNYLKKYYESSVPVVVLPPLVDKTNIKWKKERPRFAGNEIKLAYAGAPGKSKDKLDVIIHAVGKCKNTNVKLQVVGITKEEYLLNYPQDEEVVNQALASGTVVFWGRVPHTKALEIVKNSDYTIFYRNISRVSMAGFPTKFVESISSGVPVITNQTSDLAQYVKENKNGFLLDTERFEKDLTKLLKNIGDGSVKRPDVETERFDYREYVDHVREWLGDLE